MKEGGGENGIGDLERVVKMGEFARAKEMYFGGDLEKSIPLTGQVAGRIDAVKPVAQVIAETVAEFEATVKTMGQRWG